MAVVAFDPAAFVVSFPQFSTISSGVLTANFGLAQSYCANGDCARVTYCPPTDLTRANVLDLLVAHITKLLYGDNSGPASPLVGRISDATEGSVSVSTDMGVPANPNAAWYNQTPYGAMAYQMMARFRTAVYRASPGRFPQNPYLGRLGWPG